MDNSKSKGKADATGYAKTDLTAYILNLTDEDFNKKRESITKSFYEEANRENDLDKYCNEI